MPKQIGYAVLGLGDLTQRAALPPFARAADNTRLVAVVASDRGRAQALAQEFRVAGYHFDELRQCLQRDDVNAVYILLPTAMHCDYAVEAARAGVHVLCDRPMAVMADECRRMIRTCQTNRVKLMISYRLHSQPAFRKILDVVRTGALGAPRTFSSDFTTRIDDPDDVRLQRRLGGGTVYDLGVYCINTVRTLFSQEPAQVMAMTARPTRRYGDVDESAVALIRLPDERLAHFHTSFGEEPAAVLTVLGDQGYLRLFNAYRDDAAAVMEVVGRRGREEHRFDPTDQLAVEIAYFSDCVLHDRQPEPSGLDGLQDIRIVEAIYRSARDGRPVTLPRMARMEAPADQEMRKVGDRRQAS